MLGRRGRKEGGLLLGVQDLNPGRLAPSQWCNRILGCMHGTELQQNDSHKGQTTAHQEKGNFATITTILNDHYIRSSAAVPTSPPYETP